MVRGAWIADGRAIVIGMFCGHLEHTTSLLGVPLRRVRENVFLRPTEVPQRASD